MKRFSHVWGAATLILVLVSLVAPIQEVTAQADLVIEANELNDANYPQEVTFQLNVTGAVETATLTYDVSKDSCLEAMTQVPVAVEGDTIAWTWEMVRSGNPPPGTTVSWTWTVTDADGNSQTTPLQRHTFVDDRYEWQTVSDGNLNLHWYDGDEVGPVLLAASVAALERLEAEMGIELQDEVNLFIYGDTDDMRDAVLYIQDWAGGVAFTEYNIILMGVPPHLADTWGQDVVPHELAHLVVAQYGRSCVGGTRPTWLDEGLAVYAEGEPDADIGRDIEQGIEDNAFEPLRSLNGAFSAHGPEAGISYSQSYSVVDYLLNTYGQEPMQELIQVLAGGVGYDEALQQVYGFNIDGLEQVWREALGAPSRDIPPTPTPITAANVPTVVPQGVPASVATPPAAALLAPASEGADTGTPGLCNLGLVPLLLVGGLFAARNRRRRENEQ